MAYICVDRDGDEVITASLPVRDNKYGVWEDITSVEGEMFNQTIYPEKGLIEKIIGKKMTWKDEPVKI